MNTAFLGLKLLTGDLKASKDPIDIERYDTLCDVNKSCMAAVDILNDLLCYEKLDSGILKLHKENITVVPFLNDNVSMFSAQAREGGVIINVVTDFATDINVTMPISLQAHDSIFVDKFKMDQVVRNLISNALKFTPPGGTINISAKFVSNRCSIDDVTDSSVGGMKSILSPLTKKISLCCCRGCRVATATSPSRVDIDVDECLLDGYLVVTVKDSGAGISVENQKRLFKDIVQFSPEKLQAGGGSGLGLWISGGIVDLHDGKISVESGGEGMGSSFTVEIPMTRLPLSSYIQQQNEITYSGGVIQFASKTDTEEENKIGQSLPTELISRSVSPPYVAPFTRLLSQVEKSRYEVLVVDDSRLNRKMLLKCLHKEGHRCTEAEDGLEAIKRVKEKADVLPFDVILMDFVMPNMDGPTATRQLRTTGYTGAIFGVTGNGKRKKKYFTSCSIV